MVSEHNGSEAIFDYTRLTTLRNDLQEGLFEVMAGIPAEAAKALDLIRAAVAAEDWDAARAAGHCLSGMALNFGADRLAAIARRISLTSPEIESAGRLVAPLERAVEDTCARIEMIAWAKR